MRALLPCALDRALAADRLAEANAAVGAPAVINVQGDEPLITGEQSVPSLLALKGMPLLRRLVVPFVQPQDFANANQVKVVRDREGYALYFLAHPCPLLAT